MKKPLFCVLLVMLSGPSFPAAAQEARAPLPYKVEAKLPDEARLPAPGEVRLTGWLGKRVTNNEQNRLVKVDLAPLLAGYKKRPGNHPWIGEHIGKWMHAATLACANTGDAKLRAKLDGAARELIATQEADGYLGTYTPDKRFGLYQGADWDVWSHKYNLIGLLTYYQYTGSQDALNACRKMGDLLIRTFGPGKKSILSAGTHVGMAATSVLEPIVILYRYTNDARYLDFAKYIVESWDEPNGPRVLTTLMTEKAVHKTANGKAYEMLSNLVGLCELARVTGERKYLQPAINAWNDVVVNQLYLTGTASYGEHFHAPHDLPNAPGFNIGETCVSVTWIQLTSQLLRLTGEAKYGDELERSYYNHLAAAQRPDGAEWCYYTALEGTKPYGPGINCCVSSGPRGMALAPMHAYLGLKREGRDALAVNLFESSEATLPLNGETVRVVQEADFPRTGQTRLKLSLKRPATFDLLLRSTQWTGPLNITLNNGEKTYPPSFFPGWVSLGKRQWKDGDTVQLRFRLEGRLVSGKYSNEGKAALTWGPIVLAVEQGVAAVPTSTLVFVPDRKPGLMPAIAPRTLDFMMFLKGGAEQKDVSVTFVPFAEAGIKGERYRIWLGAPGTTPKVTLSLLFGGAEARNEAGNVNGSISDGEPGTFVVTYDGRKHAEDWFAVTPEKPVTITRIVYAHGQTFHDGGWFDASKGKPRVEVKMTKDGAWETIGTLDDYPATTATDFKQLRNGQEFTLKLAAPVTVVAVRVIGIPAHGDRPEQSFASCAELQAFAK